MTAHEVGTIRPARAADFAAVAAFTTDTFAWGDYVQAAWPGWIDDPAGALLVADVDGTPVAVAHVLLVAPGEAWLEGLRVAPEHRRAGWANRLNDACVAWAADRGARVARLATEVGNLPARRQVVALGFAPVAAFAHWTWDTAPGPPPAHDATRLALPADVTAVREALGRSPLPALAGGLWARGWRWRSILGGDVAAAVMASDVLVAPAWAGCAVLEPRDDLLQLAWLDARGARELVAAVQQAAWAMELPRCMALLAAPAASEIGLPAPSPRATQAALACADALVGAGWLRGAEMIVYARAVRAST